jgi:hypothetical protein
VLCLQFTVESAYRTKGYGDLLISTIDLEIEWQGKLQCIKVAETGDHGGAMATRSETSLVRW